MFRGCVSCKHWQGNKYSKWGLCNCYCVVAAPLLKDMMSPLPLKRFDIPFDPHDMKYFFSDSRVMKQLTSSELPTGVRREVRQEQDIKFITNKDGVIVGERVGKQKVVYFYTHRQFNCEYREEKK